MSQSLYEILGIKRDASEKEIKAAYRKRALNTHPDRGGDPEVFQPIAKAYEVLADPDRRRRYDKNGVIEDRDILRVLCTELHKAVINGGHEDHLLDPIRELKKLEIRMTISLDLLNDQRERMGADVEKLAESGREKELETVFQALKELLRQAEELAGGVGADLEQCQDLLKQYQLAKEIVGRKHDDPFMETNVTDLFGGTATRGG